MDRFVQWAWDRYGARYSWVICGVSFVAPFPIYLFLSFVIVAFENSSQYLGAAAATGVAPVGLTLTALLLLARPPRQATRRRILGRTPPLHPCSRRFA